MVTLKLSNPDYKIIMDALRIIAKGDMPYNERRLFMLTLDKLEYRHKMENKKNGSVSKRVKKTDQTKI